MSKMPKILKILKMNGIVRWKKKILTIQYLTLNILTQNFGLPSISTLNTQHSTLTLSTQNLKLKTQNFLLLTSILIQ